jgi:hypothetical protein
MAKYFVMAVKNVAQT